MAINTLATITDRLVRGRTKFPYTTLPEEMILTTDIGSVAVGHLMTLKTTVVDADFNYTTVKQPVTADLKNGIFCVVTSLLTGAGAINTLVRVQFHGDVDLNVGTNVGIGSPLNGTNASHAATTTLVAAQKVFGYTKTASTGVTRCYFNGFGLGVGS